MFSGKLPELWLWIKLEILVRICRAGPLTSSLWLYNLTARCHFRLVLLSIKDLKQLILSRHKVNAEWLGEGKAEQRPQIPKLVKNPSILSSREYKLVKSYIKIGTQPSSLCITCAFSVMRMLSLYHVYIPQYHVKFLLHHAQNTKHLA